MKYVKGEHMDHDVPWSNIDAVYMPWNLSRIHRMLVCANFETKELTIFYLMVSPHSNIDLEHELTMVGTNFPSCRWGNRV